MSYLAKCVTGRVKSKVVLAVMIASIFVGVVVAIGFLAFTVDELTDQQASIEQDLADITGELQTTSVSLEQAQLALDTIIENNQELQEKLALAQENRENTERVLSQTREQVGELEVELDGKIGEEQLSALVQEWEPRIARIECVFRNNDGGTSRSNASAVSVLRQGEVQFITNKHVLVQKGHSLVNCELAVPGIGDGLRVEPESAEFSGTLDIAYVTLSDQPAELVAEASGVRVCSEPPSFGSRVLILGYPATGSKSGITATDGILSGFEE
ncbi:MAG: hypothetical protein WEC58_01155, partial [Candidatus Paceibacterota bacterium]